MFMILRQKTWVCFHSSLTIVYYGTLALEGKFYFTRELDLNTSTSLMAGDAPLKATKSPAQLY